MSTPLMTDSLSLALMTKLLEFGMQSLRDPFQEHTDYVISVAYSPDGRFIVSDSWDNTIRVWDATTGKTVAGPFQGHIYIVSSVAYSPDGRFIVSGSLDKTIGVWDATTGKTVAGLFQRHSDSVTLVAYSPDGRFIVSDSNTRSIMVWKMQALFYFPHLFISDDLAQSSKIMDSDWVASWNSSVSQVDIDGSLLGESWVSCWKI